MREYNEMILRPLLRPGGRVHHDPERQDPVAIRPPLPTPSRRRIWKHASMVAVVMLLAGMLAL